MTELPHTECEKRSCIPAEEEQPAEIYSGRMGEAPTFRASDTSNNSGVSVLLLAVGLVLALILAWLGRVILMLLFAAIVVAVLLTAIVDWINAKLKLRRGLAFALIPAHGRCASRSYPVDQRPQHHRAICQSPD